jgi:microcystin degradation protein MlrC
VRRIAVAEISHETNVFAAKPTTFADIERAGLKLGMKTLSGASGTNSAFGGFITGAAIEGFELMPICSVWATPSGMIALETIDRLVGMLVEGLEAAIDAGPIDGLLLALHGAMVTERERDGDALLLEAARRVVGIEVPIVSTLDLHANNSQRMVDAADVLIGYDTYPHIDMADRAVEACTVLAKLIRGEITPTTALVKPPMLPTSQRMPTAGEPMRSLIALAHEWEEHPGVVNVTVAGGFPPADVAEAGLSVLVTTNDDPALALRVANEIAGMAWNLREEFLGGVATFDEAALATASIAPGDKPLVIVDIGDNPWTGGPGDSAELLRFLLDQGVENAALAIICDPESVESCRLAGPGNWVDLSLGAMTDRLHGEPLALKAYMQSLSDGRYINAGPMMGGVAVDLGPSAVIICGPNAPERGISVLVTSRAETPIDLNIFRSVGIEPTSLNLIGLKGKGHFRAAFEPIASRVILVEGPGITGADLTRLPFQHLRRPIWPLDKDVDWPVNTLKPTTTS